MAESVPLTEWEHYRGTLGGVWEVWRQFRLHTHYDVPWTQVSVPHSHNSLDCLDPDGPYYQGPGWYRKLLEVDNPFRDGRTLLHFEGTGQRCDVFVHTSHVLGHPDPYDAFTCDISDHIPAARSLEEFGGAVPLAVRCDNSRDLESVPSDISDFNLYGGLFRPVRMSYVPAMFLQNVRVSSEFDSQTHTATLRLHADIADPLSKNAEATVLFAVYGPDGDRVAEKRVNVQNAEASALVRLENPTLWSTRVPHLYECVVELESAWGNHEKRTRFGIRTFEFKEHGPFYLNGERLLLRGTQRHEDHAGVGPAMSASTIREEMQLIKDMGANFIRLGHYPQSELVLDLCDELGILVYEEIPWCRGGLGGQRYREQTSRMLTTMIGQHGHHPSVIIWGLGNENDWPGDFEEFDEAAIRRHMKLLHETAHALDPTRVTGIRRCDFCKDIVDVYSPSIWAGWYRGVYREYERYLREHFEDVPRMVHLEWGADNIAGRRAEQPFTGFDEIASGSGAEERDGDFLLQGGDTRVSKDGEWSEDYFCELVDWYLHVQERLDWFAGSAQWVFKDFSTPIRPENPVPYVNCKGVVERDLTPKEGYYVFQSYWAAEPMVHIHGHHLPVRWGQGDQPKEVRIYSNCPTVELFLNGSSMGVRRRDVEAFPACGLTWEITFPKGINSLEAVARDAHGTEVVRDTLELDYHAEGWGQPHAIDLTLETKGRDLPVVTVTVRDSRGNWCLDDTSRVRFSLSGAGRLCSELGTVSGSRVLQLSNGRGRIAVDPQGGRSVVSVVAEGLATGFIEIDGTQE